MEFESPSKCFKNAAMRNLFTKEVMAAFEAAECHSELICLYQNFEMRFNEMLAGGELDIMALEIIQARYRGLHTRLDEQAEWNGRVLEELSEGRNKYD